ncbi:integrase, catalytic region, zinc finger, CCHC-type containing protein [Tanacetum coccineum]
MIEEPVDPYRIPLVLPSSHLQTDDELTIDKAKQVEANDQAIQTILMGITNQSGNGNVIAARVENNCNGNNANLIRCYNCLGMGYYAKNCIEVNANCILMANLQQASTSGTHADKPPIYESDGSSVVIQMFFMVYRLGLFQAYNGESEPSRQLRLEVYRNYLEVAFKRNTCYVRNLNGVYLLKGNRSTNLYTINLHEMTFSSPICLMARATSTKSWLWHQRTDNEAKFTNQVLKAYFEDVGITHQTSTIRTPQQNKVVEQRNRTLVKAARTMLIFSSAPLFLWTDVVATACYTQNRSLIHTIFKKTSYELINNRKLYISFLHVFGALCYPKNDREDIGKLRAKGDIGFFIGYSTTSCAYRVYNRRTKKVMETMNVTFDELSAIAFEQRTLAAPATLNRQKLNASTTTAETASTPSNSSTEAPAIPITSHNVNEI